MPGPDFQVSNAWPLAENALAVATTVAGLALEPFDLPDCLNTASWLLAGQSAPSVARVRRLDGLDEGAAVFELVLDAPTVPGSALTVALAPSAKSLGGQPTNSTPFAFVAPPTKTLVGEAGEKGADIALPVAAGMDGGVSVYGRDEALRARIVRRMTSRLNAFAHLPGFGRGVEPKRNYTDTELSSEAARMKDDLEGRGGNVDSDIKAARITVSRPAPGVAIFDVSVQPSYRSGTIKAAATIKLGT